jgi:hypothetical protein
MAQGEIGFALAFFFFLLTALRPAHDLLYDKE